jgi:hypothetical protein
VSRPSDDFYGLNSMINQQAETALPYSQLYITKKTTIWCHLLANPCR